ncbi:E3 ubiquitin-protein ligase MARCH6 [Geosmithia morbida]|uniref:RING-type E3 ubiquitin transferase n=1 Tax=Geosmithia morbida TaxID=1094350 RepID=A0A9P4YNZ8_9HYPO|nr:E3 ubiquitin-protein ligase MARCH6 [Geosmithia morbida]KAF4119395.1 E3 ubiquitin-protein ligase MARCH6 [Geosmithia morbida]
MADHDAGHGFGPRAHHDRHNSQATRLPRRRTVQPDPYDAAPGICRICRSEGTPDEPLFYPCRCSGSIQHVHQDCLMEWLSHSQKKYCELCKTPFRFTKFYNPNMPHTLPITVFARQVGRYVLGSSLSWLRAIVALSFWVVGLPWFMRCGWSAMLWLSQESWSGSSVAATTIESEGSIIYLSSTMIGFDMCPASPLFAPTMTPAAEVASMLGWWANQTVTQFFIHCLFWMVGVPSPSLVSAITGPPVVVEPAHPQLDDDADLEDDLSDGEPTPAEEQLDTHAPEVFENVNGFGAPAAHETIRDYHGDHGHSPGNVFEYDEEPTVSAANFPQGWAEDTSVYRRQSDDDASTDAAFTPNHSQSDGTDHDQGSSSGEPKGKERAQDVVATLDPSEPSSSADVGAGPSRPRSVSDGPQMHSSINPLANNTWSFAAVYEPHNQEPQSEELPQWPGSDAPVPETLHEDEAPQPAPVPDNSNMTNSEHHDHSASVVNAGTSSATDPGPAAAPEQPKPLTERVTDFMWADIGDPDHGFAGTGADDHETDDDQWLDVPMDDRDNGLNMADAAAEFEVDENDVAGLDPGRDAEVVEDMEDFEGIMELLGMRGPVTNLFQNVIFCAVLVQAALFVGIFIPFNVGRVSLWFIARPTRLILMMYEMSKVIQDLTFAFTGFLSWAAFNLVDMLTSHLGGPVAIQVLAGRKASWGFFAGAVNRIVVVFDLLSQELAVPGSGMQLWSAASHEALMNIQEFIISAVMSLGSVLSPRGILRLIIEAPYFFGKTLERISIAMSKPGGLVVNLTPAYTAPPVSLDNAHWSASDLTWAILTGYVTMLAIAALYLKTGIRFARGTSLEDWEVGLIDTLHQASGILKVITVIGIEMLVFPLYCGLLLDCALLPLFAGATVTSRLQFTYNNPWTSLFVHWFVGTGYMFHFALFVSMCHFIRDPDDPEFHPVRDVLERNLTTQLRKILFSAFVYGALVIVCLGGVVWGLAYAAPGVLPIHYSSNEPVLEFPVDLLFYNFFMPLAFRVFKPGDALHSMYSWCFRKSARILRLTYFLFGERRIDEEGTLRLPDSSPYRDSAPYRLPFLGLDEDKRNVIPKSLIDILDGVETGPDSSFAYANKHLRRRKARLVETGQLVQDGRFVRAPASDRIKIPKGRKVFLEVNESGRRIDGKPDEGLYASGQFKMVYVPPHLIPRAFLFILFIWTFAAVTGVGLTVIPLILGRAMFKAALPDHVRTNDIYAFCIGVHVFVFAAYAISHGRQLWANVRSLWLAGMHAKSSERVTMCVQSVAWAAKLLYAYTFILFICPLVLSALVELYINMPLHTLMNPPSARDFTGQTGHGHHKIRIIEAWTLGLLYQRLAAKMISSLYYHSRFCMAMRAVLRRGWLDPDIGILTRAFVIPGTAFSLVAVLGPAALANLVESQFASLLSSGNGGHGPKEMASRVIRHRQAYPFVAVLAMLTRHFVVMKGGFDTLKAQVRDDAYLMGERLQNYDGPPSDTRTAKAQRQVAGRAAAML